MNKTSIFLGATALALGVAAVLPQTAFAYKGDPAVMGSNYSPERHAAMTKAFATKDYNAWKALMASKGAARKITAENFDKFVTAHELALQGKLAEAKAIRDELGLGQGRGSGQGFHRSR